MLGGLVAFWGFRPAVEGVGEDPAAPEGDLVLGPGSTARGLRAWRQRNAWVERHPLAHPEARGLGVALTGPFVRPRALERHPRLAAADFFPSPSEAPLPRGEPTRLLEALLAAEESGAAAETREAEFLAAARAARLDPTALEVVDDPWRAVITLEAERRRALQRQAERAADEPAVQARGRWLERLAAALLTAHPRTPVADYAWLYRLEVLGDPGWDTFDPARSGLLALEALAQSSDALVRALAVSRLADAAGHAEGLLDRVEMAWSTGTPTPWLAAAGADHAIAAADGAAARAWLSRLEDAVDLECTDANDKGTCRAWRMELAWSRAQLDAIEGVDAATWREGLMLASWRCELWRTPLATPRLAVTAAWEADSWAWSGWSADPPDETFAACLQAEAFFQPQPADPVSVDLVLVRDPYGNPPSHRTP